MTYDYNEHIFRLQEQRDSVARELEAMREDQNYRFREMERRTNAEAAEQRIINKQANTSTKKIRAYRQIGIESNQPKTKSEIALETISLFVFLFLVLLALSVLL